MSSQIIRETSQEVIEAEIPAVVQVAAEERVEMVNDETERFENAVEEQEESKNMAKEVRQYLNNLTKTSMEKVEKLHEKAKENEKYKKHVVPVVEKIGEVHQKVVKSDTYQKVTTKTCEVAENLKEKINNSEQFAVMSDNISNFMNTSRDKAYEVCDTTQKKAQAFCDEHKVGEKCRSCTEFVKEKSGMVYEKLPSQEKVKDVTTTGLAYGILAAEQADKYGRIAYNHAEKYGSIAYEKSKPAIEKSKKYMKNFSEMYAEYAEEKVKDVEKEIEKAAKESEGAMNRKEAKRAEKEAKKADKRKSQEDNLMVALEGALDAFSKGLRKVKIGFFYATGAVAGVLARNLVETPDVHEEKKAEEPTVVEEEEE